MIRSAIIVLITVLVFTSCSSSKDSTLESFGVFCEMVQYGAKPIALSNPMSPGEADKYQAGFEQLATADGLKIFREDQWPVTVLFPAEATQGMSVFVIYKQNDRLTQYQQLKKDINTQFDRPELLARRLGRLLGYDVQGINELLMQNSEFRTYASFGVTEQITHLYYENQDRALKFYRETLGLPQVNENQFKIGESALIQVNPVSDQYPAGLPKSTAIALLTDQLPEWYDYVQKEGIQIKYTYKPKDRGPHDGFVAIDPEGYLLEFEQFKQHPENELFMAALEKAPRVKTNIDGLEFYGAITWTYHRDLLAQENYYNEVLGFQMVADQGWTKIYQTSPTGFIGLVDERRGMENYADKKAVKIEWRVRDESEMVRYSFRQGSMMGPEKYEYNIR